jgi:hypothetical protein
MLTFGLGMWQAYMLGIETNIYSFGIYVMNSLNFFFFPFNVRIETII